MNPALINLEPASLWRHFAALAAIPRASEKEAAARNYVLALAARLGLETTQDRVGNVVVRRSQRGPDAKGAVPAVLQGHLDMVCRRTKGPSTTSIPIRSGWWGMATG